MGDENKNQNDNHSPVPSSHQRSELSNTISAPSAEEIRVSESAFQSLMVWGGEAPLINISISNGGLICHRVIIHAA